MSDAKFTPGPWETSAIGDGHGGHRWDVCEADAGDMIAEVTCDRRDEDERRANANLIAAAPDLYAACKAVWALGDVNHLDSIDLRVTVDAIRMIRAAIAKAEGGGS